jgi:hypothetical protein
MALLLLAACSTPRWSTPHRFPLEGGSTSLDAAPAGWSAYFVADGLAASLHGPVFEQLVAGSIPLSSREIQAIGAAGTPALAAEEIRKAMVDGEAWWWFPGWNTARKPAFTVTTARIEPLCGHAGVAFDGEMPAPPWVVYRVRTRAAVVGARLHFVGLAGLRRVYFDAAVPAFDEAVGRFRIDAVAGSR